MSIKFKDLRVGDFYRVCNTPEVTKMKVEPQSGYKESYIEFLDNSPAIRPDPIGDAICEKLSMGEFLKFCSGISGKISTGKKFQDLRVGAYFKYDRYQSVFRKSSLESNKPNMIYLYKLDDINKRGRGYRHDDSIGTVTELTLDDVYKHLDPLLMHYSKVWPTQEQIDAARPFMQNSWGDPRTLQVAKKVRWPLLRILG